MSVVVTSYARTGFTTTITPPRPGIYYSSVAVYNPLTQPFTAFNGVDQNTISVQTAQLFTMPSSGSAMRLTPGPSFYPYGAYLGPVTGVWFEPTDSPGSFPVTLGALSGIVQWTPPVTLDNESPLFVVAGTTLSSVVISGASDTSATVTVSGYQSGRVVGSAALDGSNTVQITLEPGTTDTVFFLNSDVEITAVVSLVVGTPPVVSQSGGGGVTYYASLTGEGEVSTPGDLTQAGGFTVTDSAGDGITLQSADTVALEADTINLDGGVVNINSSGNIGLAGTNITEQATGTLLLEGASEAVLEATDAAGEASIVAHSTSCQIVLTATGNKINLDCSEIKFFSGAAVGPQASGGTLAGVIAGLVALGLFTS